MARLAKIGHIMCMHGWMSGAPHPPLQVPNRKETELVEWVADAVVEHLVHEGQMPSNQALTLPDITVGLDGSNKLLKELVDRLSNENDHSMVLLHGMGGAGKSTLASAVFNQLHHKNLALPCCFVELDPEMTEEDIVKKQRQLLRELAHVGSATARDVEDARTGRDMLATRLQGKKVLLVVDNVWEDGGFMDAHHAGGSVERPKFGGGQRLDRMLSKGTMKQLLEAGSMVLFTSREEDAACRFLDERGELKVAKVPMKLLSEEQSLELFCRYAFGRSCPAPELESVKAAVARCECLPMALEVLGRYYHATQDKDGFFRDLEAALAKAYHNEPAGRVKGQPTLFGALMLSWSILTTEEQQSLLDIAWFLKGQPWDLVQLHCGSDVLLRLRNLGLVKPGTAGASGAAEQEATVHDTLTIFCRDSDAIHPLLLRRMWS
jgi:hypothetical protein